MSKINEIESRLSELGDGAFQKLATAYLTKVGYSRLIPTGEVVGADKSKKGTPDAYRVAEDGTYVFCEYTTQQTGLPAKLTSDIRKCFSPDKTQLHPGLISEFIFCHCGELLPSQLEDATK